MIYQRIVILCLLFGMLTLTIAEQVCAAAKQTERTHWIRKNGTDVKVIIIKDNSPGLATLYVNAENCGNAAHKTSKGGRFFSHLHVHYTFPINGYTVVITTLLPNKLQQQIRRLIGTINIGTLPVVVKVLLIIAGGMCFAGSTE